MKNITKIKQSIQSEMRGKAMREQKIVRGSERIIRTFAPLPDWLDGWDIFYRQKKSAGKRSERKGG